MILVRANQKDLYYLGQLTEQFEEVLRSILGQSDNHIRWSANSQDLKGRDGCRNGRKN